MTAQPATCCSLSSEWRSARLGPIPRVRRILGARLRYVDHPSFADPAARDTILAPWPDSVDDQVARRLQPSEESTAVPAGVSSAPFLSREQEAYLFRKMNYLKFRASRLKERLDPEWPDPGDLDEIEQLQSEALAVKNRIVEMNLRLVVSIAKKRVFAGYDLGERVSDGNLALIQAVDGFDFAKGNRFSTYATRAIHNQLVQNERSHIRRRGRRLTLHEETLTAPAHCVDEYERDEVLNLRRSVLWRWLRQLHERERWILANRYGLGGAPPRTLKDIGDELGITKERVRQIADRAHTKIRKLARLDTFIESSSGACRVPSRSFRPAQSIGTSLNVVNRLG
jgi:RNA polymerase primary sigma factor